MMASSMSQPIRHVSDTALWVAMYRAIESDRPDALFKDPWARRLAGERGEEILRTIPRGRELAWPMVVRTAVMDEIILRLVASGVTAVVNMAAGLDTRAFRLALPPSLRWFDIDLPDMIAYRREQLADATPACVHEHVAIDVSDPGGHDAIASRVPEGSGQALVITEGLLVYLTADQVGALADRLHAVRELRWWMTDLASPQLLKFLSKSWQPSLSAANAPMRFAPEEGTAFFEPHGWRETEFRSTWTESLRLKRTVPLARLWNALSRLRPAKARRGQLRMSGVVLLARS